MTDGKIKKETIMKDKLSKIIRIGDLVSWTARGEDLKGEVVNFTRVDGWPAVTIRYTIDIDPPRWMLELVRAREVNVESRSGLPVEADYDE